MLVGAARLLSAHRDMVQGDVAFMFQPSEEGYDGAGRVLAEGVLDAAGPRVLRAYGIHVIAGKLPCGQFTTRHGPLMASSDGLVVTANGMGVTDPYHTVPEIRSAWRPRWWSRCR
jgi:metal-dependent amidase/aminoacylase/carboxypeptidase family protein